MDDIGDANAADQDDALENKEELKLRCVYV
jgi:hypothetical protein